MIFGVTVMGCGLFSKPIEGEVAVTGEGGCKRPAANVGINLTDLDLTLGKFHEFVTLPAIKYKSDPKVSQLLQNSETRLLVIDYLVCVAKYRKDIDDNPEQIRYFTNWLNFMSTNPMSKEVIEWDEKHPFPKDKIKVSSRPEQTEVSFAVRGLEVSINTSQLTAPKDIAAITNPRIYQDSSLGFAFERPVGAKWPMPKSFKGFEQLRSLDVADNITPETKYALAAHPLGQAFKSMEGVYFEWDEPLAVEFTENTTMTGIDEMAEHAVTEYEKSDLFKQKLEEMIRSYEEALKSEKAPERIAIMTKLVELAKGIKTIDDFEKTVKFAMEALPDEATDLRPYSDLRKFYRVQIMKKELPVKSLRVSNKFIVEVFSKNSMIGSPVRSLAAFYSALIGTKIGLACDRLVANEKGILTGGSAEFKNVKIKGVEQSLAISRVFFVTESQHSFYVLEMTYSPQASGSIKVWEDLRKAADSFTLIEGA